MVTLTKAACFTDIHWGCKANSEVHNRDCAEFIKWFCQHVTDDGKIDHIIFMGDWFEQRSAINISTLNYAYNGAKTINNLGLPVFFIVGNHDLYHRHTREIYSVVPFNEFQNFTVINEPTVIKQIGNQTLLCPYLFHEEYPELKKFRKLETWWGHFEFKGFVVTGSDMEMPVGPQHEQFEEQKHIVSGHFHKRQTKDNVIYMGNTFPLTFGDAGDNNRGMMTYDHETDDIVFINWADCPKFTKTSLNDIVDGKIKLHSNARVKCVTDVRISFEESTTLKQLMTDKYNLREFVFEEPREIREAVSGTETSVNTKDELATVDELVQRMLQDINSEHINNQTLIDIYKTLK